MSKKVPNKPNETPGRSVLEEEAFYTNEVGEEELDELMQNQTSRVIERSPTLTKKKSPETKQPAKKLEISTAEKEVEYKNFLEYLEKENENKDEAKNITRLLKKGIGNGQQLKEIIKSYATSG